MSRERRFERVPGLRDYANAAPWRIDHVECLREQLSRAPRPYPTLTIKRRPASIFDYEYEDFEVLGYECHPAIKAPVAV